MHPSYEVLRTDRSVTEKSPLRLYNQASKMNTEVSMSRMQSVGGESQAPSQVRMNAMKRSQPSLKDDYDLALAGFLPLREEDEPLSDEQFKQLPGNLKKSYLMMEI